MPTISMFFGILIKFFNKNVEKHHRPHIHAKCQEFVASYSILDGTVLAGTFPAGKHALVVAWIEIHRDELLAVDGEKPYPIKGLE